MTTPRREGLNDGSRRAEPEPIEPLVVDSTTRQTLRGPVPLVAKLRRLVPQGRTLPPAAWRQRHRTLSALLWLHAFLLPAFGLMRGFGLLHSLADGMVLVVIAVLAHVVRSRPRLASAIVSLGLVTCSAILVHLSDGYIEAHFHFFVVIVLLTLYEDWVPLLLAAAYTGFHHGVLGMVDPASVYNHPAAIEHPWTWAAIHAGFVAGAGIAAVGAWRLNEEVRAETREAYRRAHESEQRFKSAFGQAPIGMGLVSIQPETAGTFLQVNRAMSELLGYSEDELSRLSVRDVTHPDDLPETTEELSRVIAGDSSGFDLENRYVRADGSVIWGLLHVSLVRDTSGAPLYVIGQVQDITERKTAREQLARQALHDDLTGLSNRRKLFADLDELFAASSETKAQLLLFDLDGFKAYNDTFGHPAGDALLRLLAQRLERTVERRGRAYRMGGDEFCVLAPVGRDEPTDLALAAAAALEERGDGFNVTSSYGSVLLPTEASTPTEALGQADQRMYARKSSSRDAAAQSQITRTLVTVIDERSGRLRRHLDDVANLCEAVGNELDMSVQELTSLRQAASLHDIGKIAVPDAILNKQGPLSSDEWELIRRHTLIGERIVAAAPALSHVAHLIRSSHERHDGTGYPDQLAGDDIPIGARVIAVCDAYDAMTSDRPYAEKLTSEAAIEEIRRCAGTQFDPAVVEAFCAAHAALESARADEAQTSAA
jgi:diguanylate cyclase (GGDEF)-like protein/PAS domain S-box-containing protein